MQHFNNWRNMSWQEQKAVQDCIARHQAFSGRAISGYDYYGSTELNGVQIAHARNNALCPNCGKYRRYEVYSYEELMYAICEDCENEYMFPKSWEHENHKGEMTNSLMTSRLQSIIMRAIPSYNEARQAYLTHVQKARKWFNTKRREQIGDIYGVGVGDKLSDEGILRIYSKEQEKLELARQKEAAKHVFDDMNKHLKTLKRA